MRQWWTLMAGVAMLGVAPVLAAASTMVQDFETDAAQPKVWIVGVPNENASVALSGDKAVDGKQSLKLHYHFTGNGQYLGVPFSVKIDKPVHKLQFQIYGDGSGSSLGVYVTDSSGETHKFRPAHSKIDFTDWKEQTVDLDAGHETWGGDKNGKIDYPVKEIVFEIGTPGKEIESNLYFDSVKVDADKVVSPTVSVVSPAYCAEVKGETKISVAAKGFKKLTAKCWKQGEGMGASSVVAQVSLDAEGKGSFAFPADQYPHGPITLTIAGAEGDDKDNCYLQLYNKGGVSWKEGIPAAPPPAAKGLKLIFADDFDGPLSIGEGAKDKYYDHKPPRGGEDFSSIPFTSHAKPNTPFAQRDSYLRIRVSEKAKSAGLISSLKPDASGIKASIPCYFECRFIGPNAIGSWPAFWLMTDYMTDYQALQSKTPVDELDIIEAYGGEGPGHPDSYDKYMISPHCWNQGDGGIAIQEKAVKQLTRPTEMAKAGIPSTWYEASHTYGCLVTETDTVYYCDDIEVGRHATLPLCKKKPLFFMINLATGGGWPVDLSRYDGTIDMYVDYVRVYGGK